MSMVMLGAKLGVTLLAALFIIIPTATTDSLYKTEFSYCGFLKCKFIMDPMVAMMGMMEEMGDLTGETTEQITAPETLVDTAKMLDLGDSCDGHEPIATIIKIGAIVGIVVCVLVLLFTAVVFFVPAVPKVIVTLFESLALIGLAGAAGGAFMYVYVPMCKHNDKKVSLADGEETKVGYGPYLAAAALVLMFIGLFINPFKPKQQQSMNNYQSFPQHQEMQQSPPKPEYTAGSI